jgi:hypothetical protein
VEHPFPSLVAATKGLATGAQWSAPDPTDNQMGFVAPLEIAGVAVAGLALRGSCYLHRPDEAVTFQLEAATPGLRTRIPLMRLDWRPATRGHKNPRRGPASHTGKFIVGSHLHTFQLNWLANNEVMRTGNLPFAEPLNPDPGTFEEALDLGGASLESAT